MDHRADFPVTEMPDTTLPRIANVEIFYADNVREIELQASETLNTQQVNLANGHLRSRSHLPQGSEPQ